MISASCLLSGQLPHLPEPQFLSLNRRSAPYLSQENHRLRDTAGAMGLWSPSHPSPSTRGRRRSGLALGLPPAPSRVVQRKTRLMKPTPLPLPCEKSGHQHLSGVTQFPDMPGKAQYRKSSGLFPSFGCLGRDNGGKTLAGEWGGDERPPLPKKAIQRLQSCSAAEK